MNKKKSREKGKQKLSRIMQEIEIGSKVALVNETSKKKDFHSRFVGRTGIVESKKGRAYVVKTMDGNEEKRFIITPVHLKRLG